MPNILVYSTRIEIFPYEKNSYPELEKLCSIYDRVAHKYIPEGYCIVDNKLILPRGISLVYLERMFRTTPTIVYNNSNPARMKYNYEMTSPPRNANQELAIDFLLSRNKFVRSERFSQLSLNLDTGFGKTYCAINALLQYKKRAVIITHQEKIKKQWLETLDKLSNVKSERVLNITGSKIIEDIISGDNDYDIYLVNHQTITSYARNNGWESITELFESMDVGVKVIDEAHLCFKNIIYIDFFTNVKRNYYLTATFDRSDPNEIRLFKMVFANTTRFGEEISGRKHIIYNFVFYNSNPTPQSQVSIKTNYGVSSYRFAEYAFDRDPKKSILTAIVKVCDKAIEHEGKTMIVAPKIDNTLLIKDILKKRYPDKIINAINSKNDEADNERYKIVSDIIITTIKGMGVGSDVKGLRNLIILEPHSSKTVSNQLIGRLREYSKYDDTYAYEIIDAGFQSILRMASRRFPSVKKKCKEVIQSKLDLYE